MTLTQTDRFTPVVDYISDLLEQNKSPLGLEDVWYGDQNNIPRHPAVAVEAAPYHREIAGIGGKGVTQNTIRVFLIVYVNKIQDVQATRKTADQLAESIMDVLHTDVTMGGLVIHGHVTDIEPGYTVRNNSIFRSARVTWQGLTKTVIS